MERKKEENTEFSQQVIQEVLVVEDEYVCQKVVQSQLENLRYKVDLAVNAVTAIRKIQNKAYTLIVTDLGLPDIPGDMVIQSARYYKLNKDTPLLILSAQISEKDFKKYHSLGADGILIKPCLADNLEKAIDKCHYKRKFDCQLKLLKKKLDKLQEKEHSISNSEKELADFSKFLRSFCDTLPVY